MAAAAGLVPPPMPTTAMTAGNGATDQVSRPSHCVHISLPRKRPGSSVKLDFVNNVLYDWGGFSGYNGDDTAEEIAIKDTNGIVTRYKRAEITAMQQMKISIMPAGLQMTMTTQELVDLVEYLAGLKKQ